MIRERDDHLIDEARRLSPTEAAILRWREEPRIRFFFDFAESTYDLPSEKRKTIEQTALRMVADNLVRRAAPSPSPAEKKGLLANFSTNTILKELNHSGLFLLLVHQSVTPQA